MRRFLIILIVLGFILFGLQAICYGMEERKIVVNIPAYKLYLYEGERLVREYVVGIGDPATPTPVRDFVITTKVVNPTYYPKGRDPIEPGKENPIGTRWIGLKDGYGIHGTNEPLSIGRAASHGCIRLGRKEIEELFDLVKIGTEVKFIYEPVEVKREGERILIKVYDDVYSKGILVEDLKEKLVLAGVKVDDSLARLILREKIYVLKVGRASCES
jgi:hypothetical protein